MDATAVRFTLSNIHCSDEGDGIGSAEPYLWTVFFKVDGDTAHVANLQLVGTATVVATPGDHGDLNDTDVSAGDDVPIPSSLGNFTAFVKPIPQDNGAPLPGVAGYIAVLLEQDSTPDHAVATGHAALNQAVQSEIDKLIPTLNPFDLNASIDELKKRIADRVEAAISDAMSTWEKISDGLDNDDKIGTDVRLFLAINEKIHDATDPDAQQVDALDIETDFKNEGNWQLTGRAAVVPSRHVTLRIVAGSGSHGHLGDIIAGSGPMAGASVQLLELDNPAPADDDVLIPPTVETDTIVHGREITDSGTYEPLPDELLGTQVTDQSGLVTFQVWPNMRAGLFTHTHTEDVLETGETTTNTTQRVIPEGLPDYGVTVVGPSGTVLARRQLVALNASGDIGTPGNPIVVMVNRDVPVVIG